jgi:hypothetical protein
MLTTNLLGKLSHFGRILVSTPVLVPIMLALMSTYKPLDRVIHLLAIDLTK